MLPLQCLTFLRLSNFSEKLMFGALIKIFYPKYYNFREDYFWPGMNYWKTRLRNITLTQCFLKLSVIYTGYVNIIRTPARLSISCMIDWNMVMLMEERIFSSRSYLCFRKICVFICYVVRILTVICARKEEFFLTVSMHWSERLERRLVATQLHGKTSNNFLTAKPRMKFLKMTCATELPTLPSYTSSRVTVVDRY